MKRLQKKLFFNILLAFGMHVILLFLLIFVPSLRFEDHAPKKVTWIKLSKGDGGNNLRANYKKIKGLPSSTIRDQKEALKKLARDKKGSDKISKKSNTKLKYKSQKDKKLSLKRSSNQGGVNLNKKSNKTKRSSSTNDALARIDRILKQRKVQMGASQTKKGDSGQSRYGGDRGTAIDPNLIKYYNSIKRKINREWMIAKKDFTGTLVAKIVVRIDSRGYVLRTWYKKSSGDGSFDDSALRAVKNAAPFPVPPTSIRDEAVNEGFLIEFNPRTVTGRM